MTERGADSYAVVMFTRLIDRSARPVALVASALVLLVGSAATAASAPVQESGEVDGAVVAVGLPPVPMPPVPITVAVGLPPVPTTTAAPVVDEATLDLVASVVGGVSVRAALDLRG